jgi:hypothetical protein
VAGEEIGLRGYHYIRNSDDIRSILIGQGYQCDFTKEAEEEDPEGYSIRGWDFEEKIFCRVGEDVLPGDYDIRYAVEGRAGYADIFKSARTYDYNTGAEYHLRVYPKVTSVS